MWHRVFPELPPELRSVTTSVWEFDGFVQVGVMRQVMLAPPVLWANVLKAGMRNVRRGPAALDQLQRLLHAPIVAAETEPAFPRNSDLLIYLGFTQLPDLGGRHQFMRSI